MNNQPLIVGDGTLPFSYRMTLHEIWEHLNKTYVPAPADYTTEVKEEEQSSETTR